MTLQESLETKIYHLSSFIEGLEFPQVGFFTSSNDSTLIAAGTYPPELRIFDLATQSMRVQRNLRSEAVAASLLDSDWRKIAILENNRELLIQGQGGDVFSHRIPFLPRSGAFDRYSANYLACGESNEIVGLDLNKGQFSTLLRGNAESYYQITNCNVNSILYAAGSSGISAFDVHTESSISNIIESKCNTIDVTRNGMKLAAGMDSGKVFLYDVRSNTPEFEIEIGQKPIKEVKFHEVFGEELLLVSDGRELRCYDTELKFYIECQSEIISFEIFENSGLIIVCCESQIENYYIPDLGAAPQWASDLEGQIDSINSLQESKQHENYTFITELELKSLNLLSLAKSESVIPEMHGFWIKNEVYQRALSSQEKIEAQDEIVEKQFYEKEEEKQEGSEKESEEDDRFNELFDEPKPAEQQESRKKQPKSVKK